MSYSTPPADFDGVAVGLRLMEKVVDLIDAASERRETRADYLQEAANLLKEAWLAVQTAAGRALKESGKPEQERVIIPEMPTEAPSEPELDLFGGNDGS